MISSLLAMTMLHMAPANTDAARKTYMACLSSFARESAKKRMKLEEFDTAVSPACTSQEAAFRRASVDADVARGIGRRTAEQGIGDEVADLKASAKERFAFELEGQPAAEPQ
jgi:hypothetical protein